MSYHISCTGYVELTKDPTVCAIERLINPIEKTDSISRVIPIAGEFPDSKFNPSFTALSKATTSDQEGFRAILNGGSYSGRTQRAVIDFICDPELEGTEGEAKPKDGYKNSKRAEEVAAAGNATAMTFVSYGPDANPKNIDTLMLEWRTKYACENIDDGDGGASTRHWGFFTWFIIMCVSVVPFGDFFPLLGCTPCHLLWHGIFSRTL